ncbi:helix-turn-helix domain-containing protein [Corynebacterium efficiens]|uniref:Helix-turn-helix domain-containing protein n=1 Tax=Corynebacterium efficiens (strain DSM 44549 / YS-314 / AJ 12310 / JCM 11189 / NBRC 100395) TaxID=196164 RepID=Q8FNI2_COREF|nr:helix-turn-helix domain-containing protein [Corynebacterium efficiens]BAC18972.1 hypothetical protein [Corynebacterium efficiens YS-314]
MSATTSPTTHKQWLTVANAAELVDCSTKTIRRLVAAGELQATYLTPRSMRVSVESLEALIQARATNQWDGGAA